MKKKIAIIGSGISGLTLANFLYLNKKHNFTVYEKNESLPLDEGYGIQLSTNSIKILNQINFSKINKEKIYHPKGVDIYNIRNKKICNLDLIQFNMNNSKYTTLQRSTLIEFLKDDIYSQHIKFGKRVKEVSELKGKILIKFDDNTNDLVDYVIGADGIFSNTRTFFEKKKNRPVFKNAIAIRSILKSTSGLNIDKSNISLLMGKNCHLVIYPINKDEELNFVCIVRHKKYNPDNIKNLLEKVVKQNSNLEKAFKEDLKSWPLYATPKMLPSTNSKVFYIGDAFNGFLPTFAQGAGQSIESAFELFNLIKDEKAEIQKIYYKNRSKRARMVSRRSNFNFFVFHFSSNFMQTIRNYFIKFFVKRKSFINSYFRMVYKN